MPPQHTRAHTRVHIHTHGHVRTYVRTHALARSCSFPPSVLRQSAFLPSHPLTSPNFVSTAHPPFPIKLFMGLEKRLVNGRSEAAAEAVSVWPADPPGPRGPSFPAFLSVPSSCSVRPPCLWAFHPPPTTHPHFPKGTAPPKGHIRKYSALRLISSVRLAFRFHLKRRNSLHKETWKMHSAPTRAVHNKAASEHVLLVGVNAPGRWSSAP